MNFPDTGMNGAPRAPHERRGIIGREALSDATMACGDRFTASLRSSMDRAALRDAVREFAQRVRAQRVPPEHAIAAFKAMLFTHPAIGLRISEERVALVAELTRMSIEEYYAD